MAKTKRRGAREEKDSFDVFQFRPVTEGLGFKKESKMSKPPELPKAVQKSNELQKARKTKRAPELMRNNLIQPTVKHTPTTASVKTLPDHEILHREELQSAIHISSKFISWVIDVCAVLTVTIIANFCIHYLLARKIDTNLFFQSDIIFSSLVPFFILYYIFYFSLFWKTTGQTFGMYLLGIKLVSQENSSVSYGKAISRAVLSFLSVVSFGIFDILGLADAFTWTKIKKA